MGERNLVLPVFRASSLDQWHFKAGVTTPLFPVVACVQNNFSHLVMDRAPYRVFSSPCCCALCYVSSPCSQWSNLPHQARNIMAFIFASSFTGVASTIYKKLPSVLTLLLTRYISESCCMFVFVEQTVGTPPLVDVPSSVPPALGASS